MHHLAANFVALANVANTDVPALADDVLTIMNGHHVPQQDARLVGVYSSAVTLTTTRLYTPYAIQTTPPYIIPHGISLLPPVSVPWCDFRSNPFILRQQEEVVWQSTDSAVGPNNHYIFSWWDFGSQPAPPGPVYNLYGTSTTAAVASTWTTITMTWNNVLPAGRYACIGGAYYAANALAFSVIFYGQYWRPGGLGFATQNLIPPPIQLNGGSGLWGTFDTLTIPQIRVLNNSTDNSHVIYLQLVRIS